MRTKSSIPLTTSSGMGNGQWSWVMVNGVVMVMGFMVLNEILFALSRSVILFFICLGMSIRETVGVIDS